MRQRILHAVTNGAFEKALTLLWLWAEGKEGDSQRLSTWRLTFDRSAHDSMVKRICDALEAPSPLFLIEMLDLPLALIEALDHHAGNRVDLPGGLGGAHKHQEGGLGYWLVRRRPRQRGPIDEQEPNLGKWFRHFRVIPERIEANGEWISVHIIPVTNRNGDVVQSVSVRLTHFADGVLTDFQENKAAETFWAHGIVDEQARQTSLANELAAVRRDGSHFWVAPELTVSPGLRQDLSRQLARHPAPGLVLAVPGSFHEVLAGRPVNRAEILDGDGSPLAAHEKLTQFSYSRQTDGVKCCEAIGVGRKQVVLLETPLGLVGVAICKDFSDKGSQLVRTLWETLSPDWLLVPSMGDDDTLNLHEPCAKERAKLHGIRSAVANQQAFDTAAKPGFVCDSGKAVERGMAGGSSHRFSPVDPKTS